jgi:hypothetical protein
VLNGSNIYLKTRYLQGADSTVSAITSTSGQKERTPLWEKTQSVLEQNVWGWRTANCEYIGHLPHQNSWFASLNAQRSTMKLSCSQFYMHMYLIDDLALPLKPWIPSFGSVIADLTWWNYLHIAEGPILASSLHHLGCQESGALCGASMVLLFKPLCSLLLLDLPVDLQAFGPWPWRQTSSVGPTALDLAPSLVVWLGSAKASCDCLFECCTVLTLAPVTAARGTTLIRSACMLNSCSANLQPREQKMLLLLEKRPLVASFKSLVPFAQLGVAWSETCSCKLLLQEALRIIFDLGLGQ